MLDIKHGNGRATLMANKRALIMHPDDNVATAVEEIQPGEEVAAILGGHSQAIQATEHIPFGFKIALAEISRGEVIKKYGEPIGRANSAIARGSQVHVHNLEGIRARGDLAERSGQ
jgi:altronate dehydratase small subunit